MKKPVILCHTWEVDAVDKGKAQRPAGTAALLKLADGTYLYCSRLKDEARWVIDCALKDNEFLHFNAYGTRFSSEYDPKEIVELRDDVAEALNERLDI